MSFPYFGKCLGKEDLESSHSQQALKNGVDFDVFFRSVCHDAKSLSFLRIHPPDVIGKYAPDSVIGKVGSGAPSAAPAASGGLAAPLLAKGGHEAGLILEQKRKHLES